MAEILSYVPQDDIEDLKATLQWINEYAEQKLPPVHRKVIMSMLRVLPASREAVEPDIAWVRETLHRLQGLPERL